MEVAGHSTSPARSFMVITMGCRVNQVETERLSQTGARFGFYPVADNLPPDLIIINTCSVTSESDRQARQWIRRMAREHPQAGLVVTGCYAQAQAAELAAMAGVVLVLGNAEKEQLWQRLTATQSLPDDAASVALVDHFSERSRAFLQVQDGCDRRCTFCTIPALRGASRSFSPDYVLAQAERYRQNGYREIVLTGINLGTYGRDLPAGLTLGQLVSRLLQARGASRLRLSSIDPLDLDESVLAAFAEGGAGLCSYLHLSLQSGDDRTLKRMGRGYDRAWVMDRVARLRAIVPDLVLGADVIAGFPTESVAAHQQTLALLEELDVTFLHVFRYSDRPGTPASAIPGRFRVPEREIKRRAEQLRHWAAERLLRTASTRIGRREEVLVESCRDGLARGKSAGFLPVRFPLAGEEGLGQLFAVQIEGVDGEEGCLVGGESGSLLFP
ncbi:MAG: tRNA (N(6)-L-threonylcarbamoyladenosine(37)-C(2))-methylthiotransferase MtaB [Magnetococcales bacterium]|nr:tRNA (N(6)-L-threonylcarbamoyladenosine(37)-C(2))-methylthiotransferase MtaB [Magnetococcales bacterium]MBF0114876.1 tRNA (N(6)-L-threonylcarbamoyladenosine(37)-C(2))-methylthiotransferase MtaB [Magnetococcales bacterium]